jgi:hypothetical protein
MQTVTLQTTRPIEQARLVTLPGVSDVAMGAGEREGAEVRLQTTNATATLAGLARLLEESRVDVVELHLRKASLEDVFLQLTRGNEESENRRDKVRRGEGAT